MKLVSLTFFVLAGIIVGLIVWQIAGRFFNSFDLPTGGETVSEVVVIDSEGNIVDTAIVEELAIVDGSKVAGDSSPGVVEPVKPDGKAQGFTTKEIMVTDGVKHSVPLNEILGGGPPKDGIPSIDNPKFISTGEAQSWLNDDEPGIAVSIDGVNRFYPYQIMVWHEIVNDTINGRRILVTYCPLCLTGFVLDPVVKGERVEFGTSGKLWKSNLVMYDRKTDTLWSQVLGEAIVGELTGSRLKVLPSDQIRFGNWRSVHPGGQVLSRSTGAIRFYGSSPYGDYFSVTNLALSLARPTDTRLPDEAFVFGIVINAKAKAYSVKSVKAKGHVEDTFEGTNITLRYDQELDVVRMFKKLSDGIEERINPFSSFWFSWVAAHPQTELYK